MKDLVIDDITLYLPDNDGDVEIQIDTYDYSSSSYVLFSELEKWVFAIREQIITNAAEAQKDGL